MNVNCYAQATNIIKTSLRLLIYVLRDSYLLNTNTMMIITAIKIRSPTTMPVIICTEVEE